MQRAARFLWVLTIIYWFGLFTLTHIPGRALPVVPISDKIEHYLAFGALGGLLFLSLWASRPADRGLVLTILIIGLSYAAVDEWTQALPFIHRDCSFLDWCADSAGIATAAVGMSLVRQFIERR
jgi:VanZ family protein